MTSFQVDVVQTRVAVAAIAATAVALAVLCIGVFLFHICCCAGWLGVVREWECFSLRVVDDSLPLLSLLLLLALLTRQLGVPVVIDCGDLVRAAKNKERSAVRDNSNSLWTSHQASKTFISSHKSQDVASSTAQTLPTIHSLS